MTTVLASSSNGRWLAFAGRAQLRLYDVEKRAEIASAPLSSPSVDLGFTMGREPRLLVVSRSAGGSTLSSFELPGLVPIATRELPARMSLVTTCQDGAILTPDGGEPASKVIVSIGPELIGYQDWPIGASFDGVLAPVPGESVLVGSLGDQIVSLNPPSPRAEKRLTLKGGASAVRSIGFCKGPPGHGGRHFWIAREDGALELFRFSDGLLIHRSRLDRLEAAFGHPQSDWLAVRMGGRIGLLPVGESDPRVLDFAIRALGIVGGATSLLVTDEGGAALHWRALKSGEIAAPCEMVAAATTPAPVDEQRTEATAIEEVRLVERHAAAERFAVESFGGGLPSFGLRSPSNRPAPPTLDVRVGQPRPDRIVNPTTFDDGASARVRALIRRCIERKSAGASESTDDASPDPPLDVSELLRDHAYPETSPIGALAKAAQLSPSETDLVALLFEAATDSSLKTGLSLASSKRAYAATVGLVFDILYRGRFRHRGEALGLLLADLPPLGRLGRLGYLLVEGADRPSFDDHLLRLHPRVIRWLAGNTDLAPSLRGACALLNPGGEILPDSSAAVSDVVSAFRRGGRLVILSGTVGSGRELLIHSAASRLGRPLLVLSGRLLTTERLRDGFREASLGGALLAIRDAEEALDGDLAMVFRELLLSWPDSVAVLTTSRGIHPKLADLRPLTEIVVNVPSHSERLKIWRLYLGDDALLHQDLVDVSALYNVGIGAISKASQAAHELASFEGVPLARRHVKKAIDQLFQSDLAGIAKRVEVKQTWDDVVLTKELGEAMESVIHRVRHRATVLGDWGFDRKLQNGLGLLVLLSGPPGTGKSMLAGLVAKELGLDLQVIDLSQITSKWLGETEKNLRRAFDAAEAGHVLLLFDEADSVLGKRTSDVKSSNDRHANLETNFILSRLEQFGGVAFFTTNAPNAIDNAVIRRMSLHLKFQFPDESERAELWRRMIPKEAPVASDIDFLSLGQRFKLSGGIIRNVVLRAAFLAASEQKPIAMRHLLHCVDLEYRDRGHSGGAPAHSLTNEA